MRRSFSWLTVVLVTVVGLSFGGCSPPEEEEGAIAGDPQEWAWLEATGADLAAKRAELKQRREEVAAGPQVAEEAAEAEEGGDVGEEPMTTEELAAEVDRLDAEIGGLTQEFGERLVGYINSLQIPQGEPLSAEQLAAIRLKSAEDIALAEEWIEKGGDYRRAIEIYQAQLIWDPDNEALLQALRTAEEMRFMTEERFALAEKGMTRDQVKGLLGAVNLNNIKEYPDKGVIAWFYLKGEGGAAGVYFREDDKAGDWTVYELNFNAVERQVVGEESEGEAEPATDETAP